MSTKMIIIAIVLTCTIPASVLATAFTTCPDAGGTALILTGQALGSSSFSLPAHCALTITGGTATDLAFTTPLYNVTLVVSNVDFGEVTLPSHCIHFQSTITGGSINIDGLTRTMSGSEAGVYYAVVFQAAVSNVSTLSITRVALALRISTSSNYLGFMMILFVGSLSSIHTVNVSACSITGSATTTRGRIHLSLVRLAMIVDTEVLEFSYNSLSAMSLVAKNTVWPQYLDAVCVSPTQTISLIGAALFTMRGNVMKNNVLSSSGHTQMMLMSAEAAVSGVNKFIVEGLIMTGNAVSAVTHADMFGVLFFRGITMVSSGIINISDVYIGGSLTHGKRQAPWGSSYGARIIEFNSLAGVSVSLSVTNSIFDFSTGSGMTTTGASVVAMMVSVSTASGLQTITVTNNSIRGIYAAAHSTADCTLFVFHSYSPLSNIASMIITDNVVHPTSATAVGHVFGFVASFNLAVSSSVNGEGIFDVRRSIARGSYTSSHNYVCVGIAVFGIPSATLTGFGGIYSQGASIEDATTQSAINFTSKHGSDSILVRCAVGGGSSASGVDVGVIVGAVLGSIVGVAIIFGLAWYCLTREDVEQAGNQPGPNPNITHCQQPPQQAQQQISGFYPQHGQPQHGGAAMYPPLSGPVTDF